MSMKQIRSAQEMARAIGQRRKQWGVAQQQMGDVAGYHRNTVRRAENGSVNAATLFDMAAASGVRIFIEEVSGD